MASMQYLCRAFSSARLTVMRIFNGGHLQEKDSRLASSARSSWNLTLSSSSLNGIVISTRSGLKPHEDLGIEDMDFYRPGGYHPIAIDELLHDRYRIVDKLGFGGYSTVWLSLDVQSQRYVAVKVGIDATSRVDRESEILHQLSSSALRFTGAGAALYAQDMIPIVLDEFDIKGPNGIHHCLVTQPAEGSVCEARGHGYLFPLVVARALAAKLTLAVAFIHSRGYIHGDIHNNNTLIQLSSSLDGFSVVQLRKEYGEPETDKLSRADGQPLPPNCPSVSVSSTCLGKSATEFDLSDAHRLILCDFGEAFSPDDCPRAGKDSHIALPMRAPEAHFEPDAPLSYASDIWSLALAIWEIVGMKFPFDKEEWDKDEMIMQQTEVLGSDSLPMAWQEHWHRNEEDGGDNGSEDRIPRRPSGERIALPPLRQLFFERIQKSRFQRPASGVLDQDETEAFLDLMRGMLQFDPLRRFTMSQVLESRWMVDWALPALARSRSDASGRSEVSGQKGAHIPEEADRSRSTKAEA